ncbi:DUF3168 domain-containing protein [Lichenifustis flavocetrariae]|uniref:DUF3168 domain-containing protein n=1 Tax=Lichenifustis flavocetrariae TaxID=2949735 RepID=A0AA42CKV8_9HYPH|nr:DUF3168 domain-containing protein [Lichenifustis flavocetrariae]MCW6510984.1 DUF3168 domain-containing protein [Lichenifustis flavocetrariae]
MIAQDRQQAVLTAVIAALTADAGLAGLVGKRIYDAAAAVPTTPCVTLKLVSATDASTADTEAQTLMFDIDVWDRYALATNISRPRAVMRHVRRILHMQPLSVTGCNLILLRCTSARGPFRDPDDVTLHGVVTVSALAGHETT